MNNQNNTASDSAKTLILTAENAIGEDDLKDYRLKPSQFVDLFKDTVPSFSEVLRNAALVETARRYEQKSSEAKENQTVFKKLSAQATWTVFIATVTAAVITGSASLQEPAAQQNPLALVLGVVALLAGAYSAMLVYQIKGGNYLTRWMGARAAAEKERLGYFNRLVQLVTTSYKDKPDILLFSLELFRRYQLGMQQVYFTNRGGEHRHSMDKTLKMGSVAAGIIALGSGGTGILGYFEPKLLPYAAVGILGSALATVASRREEINQDEHNAQRYAQTSEVLSQLREKHTDVQKAVAVGNTQVLVDYVNAVQEQLSLENQQWLAQADSVKSAVDKLAESLQKQAEQGGKSDQS